MIRNFTYIIGKTVEIHAKQQGTLWKETYKGVVKNLFSVGEGMFIELDTNEIINTNFIEHITLLD